jgi:hypothetical protein
MAVTPQEAAQTLLRRTARRQALEEKRAAEIRDGLIELVRSRLCEGGRAWLIGSLAWGGFGVRSDADLVFDGVPDALVTDIETIGTTVYRIEIDTLSFQELPASFRERVEREGLALHGG